MVSPKIFARSSLLNVSGSGILVMVLANMIAPASWIMYWPVRWLTPTKVPSCHFLPSPADGIGSCNLNSYENVSPNRKGLIVKGLDLVR